MADELLAATRDATLYLSPGRAGRYHVVVNDAAACNQSNDYSRNSMPLILDRARPAAKVPAELRCRRRACARLWP